ncbi:YbaB/EbfC family nucleoid-associated protein [Actinomadura opuntiae]|uniref:YbaB/EbfC family nucleoid-associated protein n=1 Tax=Actinomadura sp. OS1-43 TaxID=604315 RepID=UPI00255AF47A|nr:YbaB/EbfC family nucleoid-associated protein [Actinomadura sp. OS1-43]MDL4817681.1 YbaB/EbfC family nucleoid-associated protein [Actinomadura sp. OS1-43]
MTKNRLRDELNISISNAPRTAEDIEDRRRAAARRQGRGSGIGSTGRTLDNGESEIEESIPTQASTARGDKDLNAEEKVSLSPSTPSTAGDSIQSAENIRSFQEKRHEILALVIDEASLRQYTAKSPEKGICVTVDGNGRLLDMSVSPDMLKTQQSKVISSLIMTVIAQARAGATSDWLTHLQDAQKLVDEDVQ